MLTGVALGRPTWRGVKGRPIAGISVTSRQQGDARPALPAWTVQEVTGLTRPTDVLPGGHCSDVPLHYGW